MTTNYLSDNLRILLLGNRVECLFTTGDRKKTSKQWFGGELSRVVGLYEDNGRRYIYGKITFDDGDVDETAALYMEDINNVDSDDAWTFADGDNCLLEYLIHREVEVTKRFEHLETCLQMRGAIRARPPRWRKRVKTLLTWFVASMMAATFCAVFAPGALECGVAQLREVIVAVAHHHPATREAAAAAAAAAATATATI